MELITSKPHLIIWASLPILLIVAYLVEDRANIMIPMVILLSCVVALYLALTGLGYWLVLRWNGIFLPKFTQIHVWLSISIPIFLCVFTRLFSPEQTFARLVVGTSILLFAVGQLIFLYNLIVGLRGMSN